MSDSPAEAIDAKTLKGVRKFLVAVVILAILLITMYFLTIGQALLPRPKPIDFTGEKIELRCYSHFVLPLETKSFEGTWARAKWKLLFPGQARLVAVLKSSEVQARGLQGGLEDLDYVFPENCFVQNRHHPPDIWIAHYPSMLKRIETDLRIKPHTVTPFQPLNSLVPERVSELVHSLAQTPLPASATHIYGATETLSTTTVDVRFECSTNDLKSFLAASPLLDDDLVIGNRTVLNTMNGAFAWWQPDRLQSVSGSQQSWKVTNGTASALVMSGDAGQPGRVIVYLSITIE